MADLSVQAGSTSQSINVYVKSSSTGNGLTGLAYNTSGLTAYYSFTGTNAGSTAITLATLAAVNSAWSSGGFKEIDSTHAPGLYRLDIPNAALAASKGREVTIILQGASGMTEVEKTIELTAWDNQTNMETQVLAASMTEAYPVKTNAVTAAQALYAILQYLYERSISSTTETIKKRDQSTTAKTATINSATSPTTVTETT